MDQTKSLGRRDVLRAGAGLALASTAASAPAAAQQQPFDGFLANTSNFDGVVDERGSDSVTVAVGAEGNNGNYAFGPAAIQVDPGTTVVWKWTGKGQSHDVVAEDGSFTSEYTEEEGFTFEHTFEAAGVTKYACTPHRPMGMRGVVVVGALPESAQASTATEETSQATEPDYGDWFDNVSNYEETVDRTGQQEVRVTVGAEGNDGNLAFGPAAIRVDPGTTVVWEWNGKGGTHNVVAADGSFESEMTNESGFTFEHTFESAGVTKYACVPHEMMGMKGAVVVESVGGASDGLTKLATLGGGVGLFGLLFALFLRGNAENTPGSSDRPASR
jgi:halocyanin-like protein